MIIFITIYIYTPQAFTFIFIFIKYLMELSKFLQNKISSSSSSSNSIYFFLDKKYSLIILIELLISHYLKSNMSLDNLCNILGQKKYSRRTVMLFLKNAQSKKLICLKKNSLDKRVTFVSLNDQICSSYENFRDELIKFIRNSY